MKKLGLLLITSALTLGLAACGGAEEEASTEANEETPAAQQEETSTDTSTTASDADSFTITATNWEFTSDHELVIKKGSTVELNLVNKEGFHTIGNEELGIELTADAPEEFTADAVGEYELICSTVCGAMEDHEAMTITLKVVE
jgi:cytochrome c oxidase subunit II